MGGSHRRRRAPARGHAPRTLPAHRDRPGPRAVGAAGERAHADGRSRPVKATLSVAALLVTLAARGGRPDELPPARRATPDNGLRLAVSAHHQLPLVRVIATVG